MFCRRRKVGSSENDDCRSDMCIFSNITDAVFDTLGLGLRRHVAFSVTLQLPSDRLPFSAPHLSLPMVHPISRSAQLLSLLPRLSFWLSVTVQPLQFL